MIIVDNKLNERQSNNNPVKIGIIGTGAMGTGLINQIVKYTKGIIVSVVYNRDIEFAKSQLGKNSIKNYYIASTLEELNGRISRGEMSLTDDIDLLLKSRGLDLIVELTGSIDFAAQTIIQAFEQGKSVLTFNAELESTLGYFLKQKAREYNVSYSLADGDQPGVTLNLYRFVTQMGFRPLVCGNIKGLQDRNRTPATQEGFARQWDMSPHMVTSFADGTKISFEQACIANATGMSIAQRGMLGYHAEGHVDELMHLFDIQMLEQKAGIVDYLVGPKPGPGVFIYAKAPDDGLVRKYLDYMKLGKGPLYCFYVPYHLLFLELPFSISRMADFNDTILTAQHGIKVEVVAIAKTNLRQGEKLDGIGGFKTYGVCEEFAKARQLNLLPMGIAEGATLLNDIPKDQEITLNDISFPSGKISVDYYFEQIKLLDSYAVF
jgi:predicted homoserine dehydrogenase-like protein